MAMILKLNDRKNGTSMFLDTQKGLAWKTSGSSAKTNRGPSPAGAGQQRSLGLSHDLDVRQVNARCIEFRQRIENRHTEALRVSELPLAEGFLSVEGSAWQVMHSELFKVERHFPEPITFYTGALFAPLAEAAGAYGLSEDTPFPGLFLTHPERGTLLISVLSQDRFKPHFILEKAGKRMHLKLREAFTGIPSVSVPAGATLEGEQWVALYVPGGVEDALDAYYRMLEKRIRFRAQDTVLSEAVTWGSWNYNYRPRGHGDITHDHIVANARALSTMAPRRPRFVMIDDGYQPGKSSHRIGEPHTLTGIDIFHSGMKMPHDPVLFPHGMKELAKAIVRAGAQPAIWTTPILQPDSTLLRERPDWSLRAKGNRPWRPGAAAYLDYSLPEVRAYTRDAWDTIVNQWGYKGVKLDFWTPAFEMPEIRYRNREHTAIELRNMLLQDLRDVIPDDGFLLTCCSVNSGNPFLGRYAEASRMSLDLGDGEWSHMHAAARWLSVVSLFYRGHILMADPDTIGWCPRCSPEENKLWATMALANAGMCEIGGDLANAGAEEREFMTTAIDNFQSVRKATPRIPRIGIADMPASRCRAEHANGVYEAYMNWQNFPREFQVPPGGRDVWTGRKISGRIRLPSHDAMLLKRS